MPEYPNILSYIGECGDKWSWELLAQQLNINFTDSFLVVVLMAHASNPNFSGGRDQKPAWWNNSRDPREKG
jgi:hypothetical protein